MLSACAMWAAGERFFSWAVFSFGPREASGKTRLLTFSFALNLKGYSLNRL